MPQTRLPRLRELCFALWDPLRLAAGGAWEGRDFVDQYDGYLIRADGMLQRGVPAENVVAYLVEVETGNLGLSGDGAAARAEALVAAMTAE